MKNDRIGQRPPIDPEQVFAIGSPRPSDQPRSLSDTSIAGPYAELFAPATAGKDPKVIGADPQDFRQARTAPGRVDIEAVLASLPVSVRRALRPAALDLVAAAREGGRLGTQELYRPGHERVLEEYARLLEWVATLTPDRKVGDLLNEKDLGDGLSMLWKTDGDHKTLRFFQERGRHDYFDVTYHHTPHIVDGRTVVRRFIGYPRAWRADTFDANTREYLGRQGADSLLLQPQDRETLERYRLGTPEA